MLYRQEGELVPFTAWPWMRVITQLQHDYFKYNYNFLYAYFKKDYLWVYWDLESMNTLARWIYHTYGKNIETIYRPFRTKAQELEQFYQDTFEEDFTTYSPLKLLYLKDTLWEKHTAMWGLGLFIDSFDPGTDQEEMARVAQQYAFTPEEITTLTTPAELTFASERRLEFLRILHDLKAKGVTVIATISSNPLLEKHRKKFDYYQYSYAYVQHLSKEQLKREIKEFLQHPQEAEKECTQLQSYAKIQKQNINQILQKYKLAQNPLFFFQQLTYWREHRKKANLMGVHIWHRILEALEVKTGIPKRQLEYLNHDEISLLIEGKMSGKVLKERYEKGIMIHVTRKGYTLFVGKDAIAKKQECEKKMMVDHSEELKGQIACKGIVRGRVRIIAAREDFAKFKEGEVLVAGMTRPEHVPLMKKAVAIITNEGGVTCHAAIVSRELGKPCIIGTKVATEVLRNGEMVEVDAEKGKIRKVKK